MLQGRITLALLTVFVFAKLAVAGPIAGFAQTNLVSDLVMPGVTLDPNLKNPWGVSFGSTPFWVSDQVTGVATLYNGAGAKQALTVSMPPAGGVTGNPREDPTGTVFNNTASFRSDLFIFATLSGTIDGWRGAL